MSSVSCAAMRLVTRRCGCRPGVATRPAEYRRPSISAASFPRPAVADVPASLPVMTVTASRSQTPGAVATVVANPGYVAVISASSIRSVRECLRGAPGGVSGAGEQKAPVHLQVCREPRQGRRQGRAGGILAPDGKPFVAEPGGEQRREYVEPPGHGVVRGLAVPRAHAMAVTESKCPPSKRPRIQCISPNMNSY